MALRRRGRVVASLRLTKDATAYKHLAERTLLEVGLDPVDLEDGFHDLWLDLRVVSYLATLGAWVTIVQGVIFVVCVLIFRRGVVGELGRLLRRPL